MENLTIGSLLLAENGLQYTLFINIVFSPASMNGVSPELNPVSVSPDEPLVNLPPPGTQIVMTDEAGPAEQTLDS